MEKNKAVAQVRKMLQLLKSSRNNTTTVNLKSLMAYCILYNLMKYYLDVGGTDKKYRAVDEAVSNALEINLKDASKLRLFRNSLAHIFDEDFTVEIKNLEDRWTDFRLGNIHDIARLVTVLEGGLNNYDSKRYGSK